MRIRNDHAALGTLSPTRRGCLRPAIWNVPFSKATPDMVVAALDGFERRYVPEPNSGCWLWTSFVWTWNKVSGLEYGRYKVFCEQLAHRVSYLLFKGEIPAGAVVRHTCDNSYCVNPDHLALGTQQDNQQDILDRDRLFRARTWADVLSMKLLKLHGVSYGHIASRFGISSGAASGVIRRSRHLDAMARRLVPP